MLVNILLILLAYYMYDWWSRFPWIGNINKKCVFVTGCDSGFGNRTARSLCDRGVYVFAGCLTPEGASKLREDTGERIDTLVVDVASTESIQTAYQYICKNIPHGKEFWGVVNNAGVQGNGGPIEFLSRDDYRNVMEVNCFGPMEVCRIFLPLLKKSKGRIINTASMVSEVAIPGAYPYVASKFALRSYTEALRYEKAMWGIHVAVVEPGLFKTNIVNLKDFNDRAKHQWIHLDPEIRDEYGEEFFQAMVSGVSDGINNRAQLKLTPVVEAYEHALFSRKPHHKYNPGMDSKVFVFMKHYFPGYLLDKVISVATSGVVPRVLRE